MTWYVWVIMIVVLGSILGGLKLLKDSARKLPLTDEQLERIKQRNREQDVKDQQERDR